MTLLRVMILECATLAALLMARISWQRLSSIDTAREYMICDPFCLCIPEHCVVYVTAVQATTVTARV